MKRKRDHPVLPQIFKNSLRECHRSLQNQPVGVESKPVTERWLIHIRFLGASKWLFNYFVSTSGNEVRDHSRYSRKPGSFAGCPGKRKGTKMHASCFSRGLCRVLRRSESVR